MATQRAESGAHICVARMLLRSNPKGEGVFFTSPTSHTHFAWARASCRARGALSQTGTTPGPKCLAVDDVEYVPNTLVCHGRLGVWETGP